MKTIKSLQLFLLMTLIINSSFGQTVLLSEDFETWPPEGFSIVSGPTSTASGDGLWHQDWGEAYIRYVDDDMIYDENIITPTISLPSSTSNLLKVKWEWQAEYFQYFVLNIDDYNPDGPFDPNFNVLITTDDGATWDTIWQEDDSTAVVNSGVADWPWGDEVSYTSEVDITQYAGNNIKIAWQFEGRKPVLYWIMDNVKVFSQASAADAKLFKLTTPVYSVPGNVDISGRIKSVGSENITSFDVTYNIDGGNESAVFSVTDINIALNETYDFTHNVPFNFTDEGTFTIKATILNVNGGGETELSNNTCAKQIIIDELYIPKRTLFEDFTGSTCAACAFANENTFNLFFPKLNNNEYSLIKYPMDYPSPGDVYYTNECGVRAGFYSIQGIPHFRFDGAYVQHAEIVSQGPDTLYGYYENNKTYNAIMTIDATHTLNEASKNISVNVKINSQQDYSSVKLFVAVVEKLTTLNVGNNGETEFYQVFMKMLPNAEGKTIDLTEGQEQEYDLSADLSETNIEEYSDIEVIVFVQKTSSKEVLQSAISAIPNSVNTVSNNSVKVFPNPAKSQIFISNAKNCKIEIYNIFSQLIITKTIYNSNQSIDVSELSNGTYVLKVVKSDNTVAAHKIVISK